MSRVIFVRHGESVWNVERRFQGNSDPELSPRGVAQAEGVARRLAAGHAPLVVYTSPLRRAAATADIIGAAAGCPVYPEPNLREMGLGEWEGLTVAEIGSRWPETYPLWARDPVSHVPPGGEGMDAFETRVAAAMDRIRSAHATEPVVVVAHGGVIGAYFCHVLGLTLSNLFRFRLENGSVSEIIEDTVGTRLALLNDTSHLRDGASPRISIVC